MPQTYHGSSANSHSSELLSLYGIQELYTLFYYNKQSRYISLIHQLKYKGKQEIGNYLGAELARKIKESPQNAVDEIIPVPLHPKRQRQRGYNQSQLIADGLHSILKTPINTSLKRKKHTKTQTKMGKVHRWENMKNVFEYDNKIDIKGKRILLVDDVVTTGATCLHCCDALHRAGAKSISIACLGITET